MAVSQLVTSDDKVRVVSSTQMSMVECWAADGRSLMYKRNKLGPRILPCGTPADTDLEAE